jgi:chitinase
MTTKTFITYVTTWGKDPLALITDMISKNALTSNTIIILAFASFNFNTSTYIPGFNITIDEVKQIVSLVHSHNAKILLSIGGATYPFAGSDLYSRPGDLANNINQILITCGFDGADFDIEDSYSNVPADFANNAASLINTLKNLNQNLYLSLTTAAQAWSQGCYQLQLINWTIGNLNAYQPMEYDIWIDPTSNYPNQILWDLNFYINTWGIVPNKLVLGLMPGYDDMQHNLQLSDALNLTSQAKQLGLKGVMTWDLDIDSDGVDGNAPYAYTMGIQSILFNN